MYNTNNSKPIIDWYNSNKRDLPWRNTKDPYKIWLSEIMLQQTQVKTVIPYYNRWIAQYPTLISVANSNIDQLLKSWEGLGYYKRCRNFHKACKIIYKSYNGIIPKDYHSLMKLPGLGDYSSSAIMSIAFNERYPAVDGNLNRVISRVLGIKNLTNHNKKRVKKFAGEIVQCTRPGDVNQALMDIGSLLCTPTKAECTKCPNQKICKASKSNNPLSYPNKIKKKPKPTVFMMAFCLMYNGKFAIQKRNKKNFLGYLWEFPSFESKSLDRLNENIIYSYFGRGVKLQKKIGTVKHTYSHFKTVVDLYLCSVNNKKININKIKWIENKEFSKYAFSKLNHKLLSLIRSKDV